MTSCPHCGSQHDPQNHFCPVSGQPIDLGPRLLSLKLLERYKVMSILGEGPIGVVVEVEEVSSGKRLAAKLIHPKFTRKLDTGAGDRLLQDALRAGTLGCKHIAQVFETGRDTGQALTVVRELMVGECLEGRIEKKGPLPAPQAVKLAREILIAVEAIHKAGLLNLDLSPADIFLAKSNGDEIAKLVDFGEYHLKMGLLRHEKDLTSPRYYAPEQFDSSRQPNPRSDIYGVGAILFNMLTGKVPKDVLEIAESLPPEVGSALAQVLQKALAATPKNRFQTAGEFIEALDQSQKAPRSGRGVRAQGADEPTAPTSQPPKVDSKPPEMVQPSVIVDMPGMEKHLSFLSNRRYRWIGAAIAAILVVAAIAWFAVGRPTAEKQVNVVITIQTKPTGATVTVDESPMRGNPVTIRTLADAKYHTIQAKAPGFETVERDVQFDTTKMVELVLVKTAAPPVIKPPPPPEVPEVQEPPAPAPAPTPAPEPESIGPEEKAATAPLPEKGARPTPRKSIENKPRAQPTERQPTKPAKKKKSSEGFDTSNPFG